MHSELVENDTLSAFELWKWAADSGDSDAQVKVGTMY